MKKIILMVVVLSFATSASAQDSWWNSVLNAIGLGEKTAEKTVDNAGNIDQETIVKAQQGPNIDGLLNSITSKLGVTSEQAKGGIAAITNYAKQNISEEQFAMLTSKIPGLDSILQYLPMVKEVSSGGLGGLMDKAASYNETLSGLNQLNKQFESIGLDTNMVKGYAEQAGQYLDTPQGKEAKKLLTDGLLKI